MTSETTNNDATQVPLPPPPRRFQTSRRLMSVGIIIAVLAVGAAGGAGAYRYVQKPHQQSVLLLQPAPIGQMTDSTAVAVKGRWPRCSATNSSSRMTAAASWWTPGRAAEGGKLVAKGEAITVQGRFEHGTSEAFGPPKHG